MKSWSRTHNQEQSKPTFCDDPVENHNRQAVKGLKIADTGSSSIDLSLKAKSIDQTVSPNGIGQIYFPVDVSFSSKNQRMK